jgi:accessory Sec system S-layer assembly protein
MLSFFQKVSDNQAEPKEEITQEEKKHGFYLHPSWNLIKTEERYVLQYKHGELPDISRNEVAIHGFELVENKEAHTINAKAFIRNSLEQAIVFGNIPLLLLNDTGELCAKKLFPLEGIGEIPALSDMPWEFTFEKEDITGIPLSQEGWKIAFQIPSQQTLDLTEEWENQLPEEMKENLHKMVSELEPPKFGEVNIHGITAEFLENQVLQISVFIRNGSDQGIQIEQIPLEILDASQHLIARGLFQLQDFQVKSFTSKPWMFHFTETLIPREEIDLSKWTVRVAQ